MLEEPEDLNLLAQKVLVQAMDDYVALQRPKSRRRKYIQEAWLTSVAMFFDKDFLFGAFDDENGEGLDLYEFLMLASDRENVNVDTVIKHLIHTARQAFQEGEQMVIPDTLIILGEPWDVLHNTKEEVNLVKRTISLDKKTGHATFIRSLIEIICSKKGLVIDLAKLQLVADGLVEVLTVNDGFQGTPKETVQKPLAPVVPLLTAPKRPRGRPPKQKPEVDQ